MERHLQRGYINGIDGLRAIAVLAVMLFHMDVLSFWQGGFTGVDVFFVISGYVISKSLADKSGLTLRRYLLGFYKRRLVRIAPALLVMLLVTTLASALFIPSAWISRTIDTSGLSAFFGYSNFQFAWNSENYFSPRVELNPFLHTWSLGLEEQFYLLFPLIFYLQLKIAGKGKTDNKGIRRAILSSVILTALAGSSLVYSIFESASHSKSATIFFPAVSGNLQPGRYFFSYMVRVGSFPKTGGGPTCSSLRGSVQWERDFSWPKRGPFLFPGPCCPSWERCC